MQPERFLHGWRVLIALLLSWFTYYLTQNPNIEENILNEIKLHLGFDDNNDININNLDLNFNIVHKFEYLENVLFETLRLSPSVPHLVRFAKIDINLPNNSDNGIKNYIINKGDAIVVPTYAMGRMPYLWKNPLKFDPNRFKNKIFTPSQFPIFNIPPRLCLGKHVALMEAKICIIKLLSKYKIIPVKGQKVDYLFSVTNQMKNGFKVTLEPRVF